MDAMREETIYTKSSDDLRAAQSYLMGQISLSQGDVNRLIRITDELMRRIMNPRPKCKDESCSILCEEGRKYCKVHDWTINRWLEKSRKNLESFTQKHVNAH